MSEIFFVSDVHFGHRNIIQYCNRPYTSVDEMDDALVSNWNETVNSDDEVWMLGDFAFHNYQRIDDLNGVIHLVPGNHDHERIAKVSPYIDHIHGEIHYLKVNKDWRFTLCHYPIESWRREYKYHLHGHSHGASTKMKNRMDVGVDATRLYRPMHIEEVMKRLMASS